MIKNRTSFRSILLIALIFFLASCASSNKSVKEGIIMDMATNSYQMGSVHFNDGNYLAALKSLSRAVDLAPDVALFHNGLALAYGSRGLYSKAKEHFERSIELDPMVSEAYVNLSALYLKEGEWDKAISSAQGALKNVFYSTPEFAYNNIAWGLYNKGDLDGAVINLNKAVDINPKYAWGYNNLGLALEKAGREDEAEMAYLAAINIFNAFGAAHLNLGLLFMRQGDKVGALKEFNETVLAVPTSNWALSAKRYMKELGDTP